MLAYPMLREKANRKAETCGNMANYRQDRKPLVWESRNIESILPEGQVHYLQHETQFLEEEQTQNAQIHSGDNKINTSNFFEFH